MGFDIRIVRQQIAKHIRFPRRKADGSTILAVFNLNFDPLKVPDIRCAVKPGKTEILGADGVWCKAETSYPGDVLTVNIGLQCYEAVVLKLR